MKDQFGTWLLRTSVATPSATSSRVSASGPTPSVLPDGPTTGPSGPEAAPASRSAPPEREQDLPTTGTSGLSSIASSPSALLQLSLESRLRARTASLGSTLYMLTFKHRVTPSGRPICALRASAPRTSVSASGLSGSGWPTPHARSNAGGEYKGPEKAIARFLNKDRNNDLNEAVFLAGWPTPKLSDDNQDRRSMQSTEAEWNREGASRSSLPLVSKMLTGWNTPRATDGKNGGPNQAGGALPADAAMAGWPTPAQTDHKGGYEGGRMRDGKLSTDRLDVVAQIAGPARLTATGELLTGSNAGMESGGQLNPAHSRWLMGLPPEWDACAPTVTRLSRKSQPK